MKSFFSLIFPLVLRPVSICGKFIKLNSKTVLIIKNLKAFSYKFRTALFKLFIVPVFDYFSTTFIHLGNKTRPNKIQSCFNRSVKKISYVELESLREEQQLEVLKFCNIQPPFYRQFYHFCCFIIIVQQNSKVDLFGMVETEKQLETTNYTQPLACTNFLKNNFLVLSFKTLNLF